MKHLAAALLALSACTDDALNQPPVVPEPWYGLGNSELAPRGTRVESVPATGGIGGEGWSEGSVGASMPDGQPVVAWGRYVDQDNTEIMLARWDGNAWIDVGGSMDAGGVSDSAGYSGQPAIVVDAEGRIVVAWQDNASGVVQIYLRRWDGSAWQEIGGSASGGGISNAADNAYSPVLALNDGEPVVAWIASNGGWSDVYVRQWSGSNWVELAGSGTSGGLSRTVDGDAGAPSVAASHGNIVVAWEEVDTNDSSSAVWVRAWDGARWNALAGGSEQGLRVGNTHPEFPSIAIDDAGAIHAAWLSMPWTYGDPYTVLVWRWTLADGWAQVGEPLTDNYFENCLGCLLWPHHMRLDAGGSPMVAWVDNRSGSDEIHFKRWNGALWLGLDGSGDGTGVSNSAASSHLPHVIAAGARACVTWTESDTDHSQVVMRCHDL
jgi:hypothetical protein